MKSRFDEVSSLPGGAHSRLTVHSGLGPQPRPPGGAHSRFSRPPNSLPVRQSLFKRPPLHSRIEMQSWLGMMLQSLEGGNDVSAWVVGMGMVVVVVEVAQAAAAAAAAGVAGNGGGVPGVRGPFGTR